MDPLVALAVGLVALTGLPYVGYVLLYIVVGPSGSQANLRPFRDGAVILLTLYTLARTNNPLFYFGSLGAGSATVGAGIAAFVAYDWFVPPRTPHNILAIVAAAAILLGVQLLMFGVLSDLVVTLHREQMRLIERIEDD